jgi:NitT/TauT family transport system permease protein
VSTWPFVATGVAVLTILIVRRLRDPIPKVLLPLATTTIFVAVWHFACEMMTYPVSMVDGTVRWIHVFPTPWETFLEMRRPIADGTLLRYSVATIYRVAVGFSIAALIGIPLGLWAGWFTRGAQAINPLIQALRPISPIAWIPLAILWFGVGDVSPIFLIFISSVFPMIVQTTSGVHTIERRYLRAAANFGVSRAMLFRRVVIPAVLPEIIVGMRIGIGVAWLVVVAAEMIALRSGLGYLIMDSRNAGNRYDLVIASMIIIGVIGLFLDGITRLLERLKTVRWRYVR